MSGAALASVIAGRIYDSIFAMPVLLVGSDGELSEKLARHFAAQGACISFAPADSGENGKALSNLHKHDVVACFGGPLIDRPLMEKALRARKRRPMLLLDLGPRPAVAPDVESLEDVFVYKLRDLQQ